MPSRFLDRRSRSRTKKRRHGHAAQLEALEARSLLTALPLGPMQGGTPDYYGAYPNWAYSPAPVVAPVTGAVTGGIHKFVDSLPGLTAAGANNLGQYIPVGIPDTTTYPGSDYYEIELGQYTEQMHSDLMPTTLRGYRQTNTTDPTVSKFNYLGPTIVANKDRPVRIKFTNSLPTGAGGDLFLPVDTTSMGSGAGAYMVMPTMADRVGGAGATVELTTMDPHTLGVGEWVKLHGFTPAAYNGEFHVTSVIDANHFQVTLKTDPGGAATVVGHVDAMYTQNRATLHLHGGNTVWISDGTQNQWITPAGEATNYPKGVSVQNVPDMPDPGPGSQTFIYSNQQSARLMFYHDHAFGITRLNVYAGEAAGYVLTDAVEQELIARGILPGLGTPLIIQDKTFIDPNTVLTTDPTWPLPIDDAKSDLWTGHVYMPNQNPNSIDGANPKGRWDYGPFFWPPWPVANPPIQVADGSLGFGFDGVPDLIPNVPNVSMTMESYQDTPLVNGTLYPFTDVQPQAYRFRILNGANDRFWNLQLYQASSIVDAINVDVGGGGSGYTRAPLVTITPAAGDTTGVGATATATIDATGAVTAITLVTVGSGYTLAPIVTIAPPTAVGGVRATATATIYTGTSEVGMVPAVQGAADFPTGWTVQTLGQPGNILDGRFGGVPDPRLIGPSMIQIGTEGGFLPSPVVWPNTPIGFERNPKNIVVGSVAEHNLFLGAAERADVIIDFSQFAGKTIILYNDGPAAVPAADSRLDYFTADMAQIDTGGTVSTLPGYGPNTRTIMQFRVAAATPAPAYDLAALQAEFATTTDPITGNVKPGVFARDQDPILVPQAGYNSAYNATFPSGANAYARIQSTSMTFNPLDLTSPTKMSPSTVTVSFKPKAIHELFENNYGRMQAVLGVELPFTNGGNQTTIPFTVQDPVTEILNDSVTVSPVTAGDGTQLWKITHNGVDTHPIHFHLFNVQVINRVGWDGAIRPPEPNELGWKETVRMNPLEDIIVAMRPVAAKAPFGVPDSVRLLDPTMPQGSTMGFSPQDANGLPVVTTNQPYNFGWEYVWHCHILSHEEMDMMRPMQFNVARALPSAPVLSDSLGAGRIDLLWTDPTPVTDPATLGNPANEIGFRIERAPFVNGVVGVYAPIGSALANATIFSDTAIVPGDGYSYRVVVFNAAGEMISNEVQVSVPVFPVAPTGLTATLQAGPQVSLTWTDNATNETGFVVQRSDNGGAFVTLTTLAANTVAYTDTTVMAGNAYGYQVYAVNGPLTSAASNTASVVVPTAAPTGLTAALQFGPQVLLNWTDNSNNETFFVVQRALSGGAFVALITLAANTVTYTDTTAMAGNTYDYQVYAVNSASASAASNTASVTVPAIPLAPSNLAATLQAGPFVGLTWTDNATNETGFVLQRSDNGGAFVTIATPAGNAPGTTGAMSYVDTTVTPGNTYAYQVCAVNGPFVSSAYSAPANVIVPAIPLAPSNLAATLQAGPQVSLTWTDNATDETGFVLQRSDNGGAFVTIATPAGNAPGTTGGLTNYVDITIVPGNTYVYQVCAVNGPFVSSAFSNTASVTVPAIPLAPSSLAATLQAGPFVGLTWTDNATDETGFVLQRSDNGGAFVTIATPAGNAAGVTGAMSYVDTTVTPGNTYAYQVCAVNGLLVSSAYSAPANVTVPAIPLAPTSLAATLQFGPQVSLTWTDNATNETGFVLQRSDNGGAFVTIATPAGNAPGATGAMSYVDTTAQAGHNYVYQVCAVNIAGTSGYSNAAIVSVPVAPAAPTSLGATVQSGPRIRLTFRDNATNETGFEVWRAVNGGASTLLTTLPANAGTGNVTYTDTTVVAGMAYAYQVRAVNGVSPSAYSNTATATVPAAPAAPSNFAAITTITNGGRYAQIALSWNDNSNNETGFVIQRSTDPSFATFSTFNVGANVTTLTQSKLPRGMTYYYRIQAQNAYGNSAWVNLTPFPITTP